MAVTINTTTTDEAIIYDLIGNKKITGNFSGVGTNTLTYSSVKYFVNGARYTPGDSTLDMTAAAINTLYYIRGKTDSTLEYNVSDSVTNRSILAIVYKGAATLDVITPIEDDKLGQYVIKHNYEAVTAPTVNDDIADGYSQGSEWIDTTVPKIYKCLDNTKGIAVWSDVTGAGAVSPPVGFSFNVGNNTTITCANTAPFESAVTGMYGPVSGITTSSMPIIAPIDIKLKNVSVKVQSAGSLVTQYDVYIKKSTTASTATMTPFTTVATLTRTGVTTATNLAHQDSFVGVLFSAGDGIIVEVMATGSGVGAAADRRLIGVSVSLWFETQ